MFQMRTTVSIAILPPIFKLTFVARDYVFVMIARRHGDQTRHSICKGNALGLALKKLGYRVDLQCSSQCTENLTTTPLAFRGEVHFLLMCAAMNFEIIVTPRFRRIHHVRHSYKSIARTYGVHER
jgi:hypothetical protein